MQRNAWMIPVIILGVMLAACQRDDAVPAVSHSKPKTVITSKQYTMAELQKRYQAIVDAVTKPLELASYSQPSAEIEQAVSDGMHEIQQTKLNLDQNASQPEITEALRKLARTSQNMLAAMKGDRQSTYSATAESFMHQTGEIAKVYFDGQIPPRLATYTRRMADKN